MRLLIYYPWLLPVQRLFALNHGLPSSSNLLDADVRDVSQNGSWLSCGFRSVADFLQRMRSLLSSDVTLFHLGSHSWHLDMRLEYIAKVEHHDVIVGAQHDLQDFSKFPGLGC